MKKQILVAGILLAGWVTVNAQEIQTDTKTGFGLENGAYVSTAVNPGITHIGYQAGFLNTGKSGQGPNNTFVGSRSGYSTTTGSNNTFTGYRSGFSNTASNNTFYGYQSGYNTTTGQQNTFIGANTGINNSLGANNVFVGNNAGYQAQNTPYNVFIGHSSGYAQNSQYGGNVFLGYATGNASTTGFGNTYLGFCAGLNNVIGENNVFIGNSAGANETGSYKLYIDISNTSAPLIKGDFDANRLTFNGKVSITDPADQTALFPAMAGSVNVSAYQLFVKGGILTEEVRVHLKPSGGWADYVFAEDYQLKPLAEVEQYIAANGHLPNIPSAKEVKENGIELGQMANLQQEKIEELTLYAIAQDKKINEQNKQLEQQQKEIDELKAAVKALAAKQ